MPARQARMTRPLLSIMICATPPRLPFILFTYLVVLDTERVNLRITLSPGICFFSFREVDGVVPLLGNKQCVALGQTAFFTITTE